MKFHICTLLIHTCLQIHLFEVTTDLLKDTLASNIKVNNSRCQYFLMLLEKWISALEENPIFFENPFVNFKGVKTLMIDIPFACGKDRGRKKSKNVSRKEYVIKAIDLMADIMETYDKDVEEALDSIPDIDASDCFQFCIKSLEDFEEKRISKIRQSQAKSAFKKGLKLMKADEDSQFKRKFRIWREEVEELFYDLDNYSRFESLCKSESMIFPSNSKGFCRHYVLNSFRTVKVEVLNKEPRLEIYEDFLSEKELQKYKDELSSFEWEIGTIQTDFGVNENVTFKKQKVINNDENKFIDWFQKLTDQLTGLFPEDEDYIEVVA